mmetsp:Transcript_2377/g.4306  ORF Transcript_2377/g.4306 Transcript_2377/m.4306 type:complete len:85 (-) Transcript_2377:296-550(-)
MESQQLDKHDETIVASRQGRQICPRKEHFYVEFGFSVAKSSARRPKISCKEHVNNMSSSAYQGFQVVTLRPPVPTFLIQWNEPL